MTFSQKAVLVAVMAAVLGFAFWTVPAVAAQNRACADDVKQFCADVQAGRGNVMKCLTEHQADLSAACKDRIQAAQARAQEARQACQSDAAKFCADVAAGRGAVAKCLRQHESELSAECKASLPQARSRRTPQQ
jgi:Cysteine rich repeat